MSSEIASAPFQFQRLKLANFGIFAGDMDMDRCCEVTSMLYTDIVTFPRSTLNATVKLSFLLFFSSMSVPNMCMYK